MIYGTHMLTRLRVSGFKKAGCGKRHSQAKAYATWYLQLVDALWHRLQPVGLEGFKIAFFRNLLVLLR